MPQLKKEYDEIQEFSDIASALVERYPNVFGGIDVSKICCVAIMNKTRPDSRPKLWEVLAVKMPVLMHCPYCWYVTIYNNDWVELPENLRQALVAEALQAIPRSLEEEGKVVAPDAKYYNAMLRTFGPDYIENPEFPNLLKDEVE